jgi:uncharacterized protein (DUF2252 family)
MADIVRSTRDYEAWLRRQLGRALVEKDLGVKHKKMCESSFAFLRATYWRWAETVLDVCPEVASAPKVLAVGDIHLENFGTWRDAEGRLVWGVNDFDEAAEMPYALDLVRLVTSAMLAGKSAAPAGNVCTAILRGYGKGVAAPRPIVLDRDHAWLLKQVAVSDKKRDKFWKKIDESTWTKAPAAYRAALAAAMPARLGAFKTARRSAGVGSLGRPRWIGVAEWRGAPVVREGKAVLPSSWLRARAERGTRIRCGEIANGRYRAPDPWYHLSKTVVVRRLSPNNHKIEADDDPAVLLSGEMLELMGFDLACAHLGSANRAGAIKRDLQRRKGPWLQELADRMAASVEADSAAWTGAYCKSS